MYAFCIAKHMRIAIHTVAMIMYSYMATYTIIIIPLITSYVCIAIYLTTQIVCIYLQTSSTDNTKAVIYE